MDIGNISSRYAKALLKHSLDKSEADTVYENMITLQRSFSDVQGLAMTLETPTLTDEKKMELLCLACGNNACGSLKDFFQLVLRHKRIGMILFMVHSFIDTYRNHRNIIQSKITFAAKPSEQTISRLKDLVKQQTQCEVMFDIEENPDIIGGFILEYDSNRYDASVKGKLENIRKQLHEIN